MGFTRIIFAVATAALLLRDAHVCAQHPALPVAFVVDGRVVFHKWTEEKSMIYWKALDGKTQGETEHDSLATCRVTDRRCWTTVWQIIGGGGGFSRIWSGPLPENKAGMGAYVFSRSPLLDLAFLNPKPANIFVDYLPLGERVGKQVLLTDIAFPLFGEKESVLKESEEGGLSVTKIPYPLPKSPKGKWWLSFFTVRIEGKFVDDPEDVAGVEGTWKFDRMVESPFREQFYTHATSSRLFFYTKSGNVFTLSNDKKAKKVEKFYDGDLKPIGLIVNDSGKQVAVIGWRAKSKQVEYFYLGDKFQMQSLDASVDPEMRMEALYTCARALFAKKAP